MTFTEAAVEVLRLVGRPLHYKKITEIAIERNLLSHVGKTPEITMSSRIATMVKKDRGDAPLVKVKPGIFGLREFSSEVLAMGELEEGDVDDILEAIDEEAAELEESTAAAAAVATAAAVAARTSVVGGDETDPDETQPTTEHPVVEERVAKSTHKLPGQEVFPEEDDDDEPILSKVDEPAAESDEARDKKRRRKKRRGGEGEERAGRDARPIRDDRPAREARPARETRDDRRGPRAREERVSRDNQGGQGGRDGRDDRGGRDDRDRGGRDSRRDERAPRRDAEVRGDWQREPEQGDLAGKDLSDAIEATLASRGGRPQTFVEIADGLVHRGRLQGDPSALAPTISAAVRGDIARTTVTLQRPRFRLRFGEVSLVDAASSQDVSRAEQDAVRAVQRHRELVHRSLVRRLQELPNSSLLEVIATWLNGVGVTSLRGVRRTGAQPGEFHLAGVLRRGPEEVAIAIVLVRDGLVGRERVVDVRGSLHRYGDARQVWILALAGVHSGAREEASELSAAPVSVFDGMQLARSMEEAGVGVRKFSLPLVMLDFDLFDELRGPGAPPRPAREPSRQHQRPSVEESVDEGDDADEGDEADDAAEGTNDETVSGGTPGGDSTESANGEGASKRKRRRRRRRRGGADGAADVAGESADGDEQGDVEEAEPHSEHDSESDDAAAAPHDDDHDEDRDDDRDDDREPLRDDDDDDLDDERDERDEQDVDDDRDDDDREDDRGTPRDDDDRDIPSAGIDDDFDRDDDDDDDGDDDDDVERDDESTEIEVDDLDRDDER